MKHLDKTFQSYRQRCLDFSDRFSQLLKKPSISLVGIKEVAKMSTVGSTDRS
jgi:hypothetical protein